MLWCYTVLTALFSRSSLVRAPQCRREGSQQLYTVNYLNMPHFFALYVPGIPWMLPSISRSPPLLTSPRPATARKTKWMKCWINYQSQTVSRLLCPHTPTMPGVLVHGQEAEKLGCLVGRKKYLEITGRGGH